MAAVVGIEGRLAHQPVHADLGLQPAEGVLALDRKVALFTPATSPALTSISSVFQPRPSQKRRYMRSSISAQSCASVPPAPAWMSTKQFEAVELARRTCGGTPAARPRGDLVDVGDHRSGSAFIVIGLGHVQQLGRVDQAIGVVADLGDRALERGALAAQGLRTLGIVPDRRVFQLAAYFLEPLDLGIEVKDTSGANRACPSGRRCAGGRVRVP
jgi:hypothetical protein